MFKCDKCSCDINAQWKKEVKGFYSSGQNEAAFGKEEVICIDCYNYMVFLEDSRKKDVWSKIKTLYRTLALQRRM